MNDATTLGIAPTHEGAYIARHRSTRITPQAR